MHEILTALAEQHAELDALLDGLDDDDWARATRCEGWSVADVVLHLAQTDELAVASARGEFGERLAVLARGANGGGNVDDGAAVLVANERGGPNDALRERWRASTAAIREALAAGDPHRRVGWVTGQLSIQTLATTRLAECWIHGGDVAEALGQEQPRSERLRHIARLAWRTLPYAFSRAGRELSGPVEFALVGPSGAAWHFTPDGEAVTVVEGDGAELCLVAARRVEPAATGLRASGPDADAVLELVRTYA